MGLMHEKVAQASSFLHGQRKPILDFELILGIIAGEAQGCKMIGFESAIPLKVNDLLTTSQFFLVAAFIGKGVLLSATIYGGQMKLISVGEVDLDVS